MALRKKARRPPSYRLVAIPGSQNHFVLGLKWRTVLGEDLQKVALQAARKTKATHYVQSDARSSSIGLLTAKGRETRAKTRATLFSAASAFAQIHRHGTHAVICELPDGSVWLTVVADGVVQAGSDAIFRDKAVAQEAIADATARHTDLQLHSNYWPQARPFSLPQLTAHANQQSALKRATFKLSMVSPIWWVLLAALVAYHLWDFRDALWPESLTRRQQDQQSTQPQPDPAALWKTAINAWAAKVQTHGTQGLVNTLNAILGVPVEPGRWLLTEVDCQPTAGICSAKYRRTRLADNLTLKAALPESWRIEHLDIDSAIATWVLPRSETSQPLKLDDMPNTQAMRMTWEPRWQALRPALQDFTLSAVGPVSIVVPNVKLPNGLEEPVPKPNSVKLPGAKSLVINAPLRSLYGLSLPATTEIAQIQVRYTPGTASGLLTSAFSALFKGNIYVLAQ